MEFALSEEQELLQETVRGFVARECPPARLRELFEAGEGFDEALWKGLAEMGLTGLVVPETYGGAGLEVLEAALVAEVLGAGALPAPLLGHCLATLALVLGGSEAQRERWLPPLAAGDVIGAVAFAETGDAWDPAAWRLSLEDGRLTGAKRFSPHAHVAGLLVVGTAGGGLALVDPGAGGVGLERVDGLDRTQPLSHVVFHGAAAEALVEGAAAAPRIRDAGLVLLAADAFGGAWKLIELTRAHVLAREQFGFPLAQFQAVKHQLAGLATDLEPTRALWWFAAHAQDHVRDEAERAAAIAKAHVTERAVQVARGAVELHGGIGFTWECDVQFWFKRALFDRALLGAPAHHRERSARLAGW
ncbi:MAG: acyl-CoA/acyl-ACP dehydrogenase [Deltaproteobacteria bacterium]|nr:acyl-CoA/acyl-ACP dehydrogenase [Deltaproteobacteria bacterium]